MIVEIKSEEEFNQLISKGNVVVEFGATWCGPCQMMLRVMKSIESSLDVNFVKVDVDEFGPLSSKYLVSNIPVFFAYMGGNSVSFKVNGKEEFNLLGAIQEENFTQIIKDTFNL